MKRPALLFLGVLLLFAILPFQAQAQAQEEISAHSTVDVDFPSSLTFNISAESSYDIDRIILRYRINKLSVARVTSLVLVEFDPAPVVEASWRWDMRKSGLPPGAEIQYSWRIEDSSGRELGTDWEVVRFDDARRSWDSLTEEKVTLLWYYGGQSFARELMESAHEALVRLANDTGALLDQDVKVYVYANSGDLGKAMVYPQEWMGGITFTEYGIVAIGVAPEDLAWGKRIMRHELAHLVTHQMTANPYGDIPTWLDEGLSMYAEGDLDPSLGQLLGEAAAVDRLISVHSLSSEFPVDPQAAYLSYSESYSLVDFLVRTYGAEQIQRLLDTFREGSRYDDALMQVYGFDTSGLDNLWRSSLGLRPPSAQPAPSAGQGASPSATPDAGVFGCGAASGESEGGGTAVLLAFGLLSLPGIGEAVRLRSRRGRR